MEAQNAVQLNDIQNNANNGNNAINNVNNDQNYQPQNNAVNDASYFKSIKAVLTPPGGTSIFFETK